MQQDELKQLVGKKAVDWVEDNMIVGLGTGSTVKYMVDALAQKTHENNWQLTCVSTSSRTAKQAHDLGLKVVDLADVDHIDVTIDGADEVSAAFDGIKGGGAALLFEKIVATNSNKNIWIVDQSKQVEKLGKFPLPVEVVKYGSSQLFNRFKAKGLNPSWRKNADGSLLLTDDNNYIIDLHLGQISQPKQLAAYLNEQVGVVEHGLFLGIVDTVIVGCDDGVKVYHAN